MKNTTFLDSIRPMPLTGLPVRTLVIQLDSARVLLAPGSKLTDEQLRAAGAVTDIVGPNLLHLEGVPRAAATFPDAKVWGPAGAAEKMPDVRWTGVLDPASWPFESELPLLEIRGMPTIGEVVFLHRASRSLVVTDLFFNMMDASGLGARIIFGLFGTWKRFALSRMFVSRVTDKAAFRASLDALKAWDFDDVVVSHGRVVEGGGRAAVAAALAERGF